MQAVIVFCGSDKQLVRDRYRRRQSLGQWERSEHSSSCLADPATAAGTASAHVPQYNQLLAKTMTGTRIDKWLWAARFFKTRALAARACELGRIQLQGQQLKPAREVRLGDLLHIRTESGEFEIEVLLLSQVRGPASVAQRLYRETEASRESRLKLAEERKAMRIFTSAPEGRPSKRDRRRIIQFRSQRNNA